MRTTADAVIIGGGVVGASIAYNLALRGIRDVVLVERDVLGSGSTGRSSGAVRTHYSTEVHTRLAWLSLRIFQHFDEIVGGDASFVRTGYMVFVPPEERLALEQNIAMQQRVGITTGIISKEEAKELAPGFFVEDCGGIAYEPESGHADPSGTAMAYASRAREMGVEIALENPALELELKGGRVRAVHTQMGSIETPIAVIATGPWSSSFLARHGVHLPSVATRHEVILLRRSLERVPFHPGGGDMCNLIYFRPEGHDLTLLGNGNREEEVEDPAAYNPRVGMDFIQDIWGRLTRRIPALEEAEYATGYAGLYTSTPDQHPIIDQVEGIDGAYLCTGFSGHGFKLSPMVGVVMAELILEGKARSIDISSLRMSRFREGELNQPRYSFKVIV